MRFFIGCTEICGMVSIYANELRRQGYQVTTCIDSKHRFFSDNNYDIQSNYWADYVLGKSTNNPLGTPQNLINKVAHKLRATTPIFDNLISRRIFDTHDVFIFIWAGNYLMRNGKDLEILKKKGKKIVSILVGSDVRFPEAFQQEFDIDISGWPVKYKKPFSHYNQVIRNVELYSDLIFSVPDQAGLAIRDYNHFPIPLILEKYQFNSPDNNVPVVVHAPSSPALKGTDIILDTLNELKHEGIEFNLHFIENMKNNELVQLLQKADILVDELILNGPGILSFEAMLSGCAVATHYFEKSPNCFRPPVCAIDKNNIYDVIKKLLTDKAFRKLKAFEGRAYAEANNNVVTIVRNILNKLNEAGIKPDYQPTFFRDHFSLPINETITARDRYLNRQIAKQWMPNFEQYKNSLVERGLI